MTLHNVLYSYLFPGELMNAYTSELSKIWVLKLNYEYKMDNLFHIELKNALSTLVFDM
jgi:hypothetical protein